MKPVRLTLIAALCVAVSTPVLAAEDAIGRIKILRGTVEIVTNTATTAAEVGQELYSGMTIRTGPRGRAGLTFVDDTRFAIGPNSEVAVDDFSFDSTTHAGRFNSRIEKGTLSVVSGKIAKHRGDAMTVRTPTRILGVRGTTFLIEIE
jgi:hypothetical protein